MEKDLDKELYNDYLIGDNEAFEFKRRNEISELYITENKEQIEKDVLDIIEKEETKKKFIEFINLLNEKYKNAVYLVNVL